jgi:hypothetical protein
MRGAEVYFNAADLSVATNAEKHEMLGSIVSGMVDNDDRAGNTAHSLALNFSNLGQWGSRSFPVGYFETETWHGALSPIGSIELLLDLPRLKGYIEAIGRWGKQEAAIDVGCGSFPILALAMALQHPQAEIEAVEIHPVAAETAEAVVASFGLSDRVKVVNADIGAHPIDPGLTAAVTETFNNGLLDEPGPQIVRLLHSAGIPTITPSYAQLRLLIGTDATFQYVDLKEERHAKMVVTSNGRRYDQGLKPKVSTAFFDDRGLVLDHDACSIGGPTYLGKLGDQLMNTLSRVGTGVLIYELGKPLRS